MPHFCRIDIQKQSWKEMTVFCFWVFVELQIKFFHNAFIFKLFNSENVLYILHVL